MPPFLLPLCAPVFLTSVPAPGRKVLTLMVLPGAGNWASMMALINGCTRAGDRALRLSTSSNTCRTHPSDTLYDVFLFMIYQYYHYRRVVGEIYLGEQVEAAEVADDTINLWQTLAFSTWLTKKYIFLVKYCSSLIFSDEYNSFFVHKELKSLRISSTKTHN